MGGCAASLNPLQPVITSSRSVHRRNHRAYAPVSAAFQHRLGAIIMLGRRIPAAVTFDAGSAAVKAQTDATLLEIARTVKTRNQTFVDILAHTDTTGTPQGNQALSEKRAAAVATYLAGHGVARARIASRGL